MQFLSVAEFARVHDLPERTVRNMCLQGKIPGATRAGRAWCIPADAPLPVRAPKRREMPLLRVLREQKETALKGGIYHRIQVDLTYNSNHIEGSRLDHEQTRMIFETNTLAATADAIDVDDVIETANHFRCIDAIIDRAHEQLSEGLVKDLHRLLKAGTRDSSRSWFAVGDYKRLPNEVVGEETTPPEQVGREMRALIRQYNAKADKGLDDILDFHWRFERIHPFQDGNGRVGRLLMFKECLAHGIVPFIITDELKMYYYRGLQQWSEVPDFLRDTCLTAQDAMRRLLTRFRIPL